MSTLEEFIEAPSLAILTSCTRDELLRVAGHYKIEVRGSPLKAELLAKITEAVCTLGIIADVEKGPSASAGPTSPTPDLSGVQQITKDALELRRIELREKEIEWDRERTLLDADRQGQRERDRRDHEIRMKDMEITQSIRLKELDIKAREAGVNLPSNNFDVSRNVRLVPPFREEEVDRYFGHFERVATVLKWPREVWTMTLQSVFTGKAQEAYSSLSLEDALDYDKVKQAVLRIYSLVPEAYRQKFRNHQKLETLSYVEFVRDKEVLFDRWLNSQEISTFEGLRDLILLEDFKNCLPKNVATYVSEHKHIKPSSAAVLADDYVLSHKSVNVCSLKCQHRSGSPPWALKTRNEPMPESSYTETRRTTRPRDTVPFCAYCKNRGHIISECFALKRRNSPNSTSPPRNESNLCVSTLPPTSWKDESDCQDFSPFVTDGFVTLLGNPSERIPIRILRDTGASQSFVLENVLPFDKDSCTGTSVIVQGFEMGAVSVPLHHISLFSKLVTGNVTVGIRPSLPVKGISMLLGNDLAGGKVLPSPVVTHISPTSLGPDNLNVAYPDVFHSCVVTRARARRAKEFSGKEDDDGLIDLWDTFIAQPSPICSGGGKLQGSPSQSVRPCLPKLTPSREQLVNEQNNDSSLGPLFREAVPEKDIGLMSCGYFIREGVLMRKWRPLTAAASDEWRILYQVVVPAPYRNEILSLAHDHHFSGHLGVNKTTDRTLRHFFWPGLKRDVAKYCKTCHVCQVAGKPNQLIPPAPLQPIPAMSEPFEHVILDCVGPLPRTKAGNQYLLTIMCTLTRFPEVFPLRKITSFVVVKALLVFFSIFGLPKVVQTDQGTNFMSRVFAQSMQQLGIKHATSSCYHPQTQGALERFHQTLKSMLRKFCLEFERDWDEGVPFVLFAVREVVQESLGFSPSELVFGHTVRGPLKILRESWLSEKASHHNLSDYVTKIRCRLSRACELAKENLGVSQKRMKQHYDRKAVVREFKPGDQVMILFPGLGPALQARYSGPYRIDKRVNDLNYVIATPDRKKRLRLCHVNMLKRYCEREGIEESRLSSGVTQSGVALSTVVSSEFGTTLPASRHGAFLSAPSHVGRTASLLEERGIRSPSAEVIEGRLKNSVVLKDLNSFFSHLTSSGRCDLIALVDNYRDLFSDVPRRTDVIAHDIDVGDSRPVKQHAYRANPLKRQQLQQEVKFMLDNGIAEPSFSPWSSPCLLVPKSDGTLRFCTDFRKVNAVTKPDSFPLPRMDDCVDRLGSAVFVSKIDLLKGYWQIPLTDRAKEISAFVTPDSFLQYTVMAFGFRNAPSTFQRMVNNLLVGLSNCEAYLDDLVVYSTTWCEHVAHLKAVFERLSGANLTINLAKCEFGQATIVYLGKVVGSGEVRPVQAKIEAMLEFPLPTSRRELRRFLGMVGYYRAFCKNFSAVAAPLTDLLSTKQAFQWTEEGQRAFAAVKALLTTAPVLAAPKFSLPFALVVDASDLGAGAVLLQESKDGLEHPVCFFSRKFNVHQRAYSTIEKEALALVMALEHFEVYVGGAAQPVAVYTDHNPLTFLDRMCNHNQRLMRWSLILQSFNITIRHIRGRDNVVADALSRA